MRTILLSALLALPAAAQTPPCTGLTDALAALQQRYGEVPRVSVLLVTPDGSACMVASGEAFEVLPGGVEG